MSWPRMPLRRPFRVVNGGTPTADQMNWGGGIPWATPVDLGRAGGELASTARTLTRVGAASGSTVVPAESIIVSTRAPVGYVARAKVAIAFNQGCKALVPVAPVDSRYFVYQLASLAPQLNAKGQGSTFQELSADSLAETVVTVPPMEEQRRIADFLDVECGKIDMLSAMHLHGVELARERFETFVDWELRRRFEFVPLRRLVSGLTVGVVVNPSTYVDALGEVVFFRGANVSRFSLDMTGSQRITKASNRALRKSRLRTGDIVSVRVGDPGVSAVVPPEADGSNCASLMVTRIDGQLDSTFLCHVFNSRYGQGQWKALSVGAAQKQVNVSAAGDFKVPVVSISSQRILAAEFERLRLLTEEVKSVSVRRVHLLNERRQALIAAAVHGELDAVTGRIGSY